MRLVRLGSVSRRWSACREKHELGNWPRLATACRTIEGLARDTALKRGSIGFCCMVSSARSRRSAPKGLTFIRLIADPASKGGGADPVAFLRGSAGPRPLVRSGRLPLCGPCDRSLSCCDRTTSGCSRSNSITSAAAVAGAARALRSAAPRRPPSFLAVEPPYHTRYRNGVSLGVHQKGGRRTAGTGGAHRGDTARSLSANLVSSTIVDLVLRAASGSDHQRHPGMPA